MERLEPHEDVPSAVVVLFVAWRVGLERPGPGLACAVPTLFVDGAGDASVKPVGNVHFASVWPQSPVPGGGVLLTVSVAEPVLPVSMVSRKRWLVVLARLPLAVGVTLTVMTQEPFAATRPPETVMLPEPAAAVE